MWNEKSWLWKCRVATSWEKVGVSQIQKGWWQNAESAHLQWTPYLAGSSPCGEKDKVDEDSLTIIFPLLPSFRMPTPILPSPSKSPFLLISNPLASDSLTIPGIFPAYISERTIAVTIAVVCKSFFHRTASPHRKKNSWFRKIKFRYTRQRISLRPSDN